MTEGYRLHQSLLYQLTLTSRLQERRLEEGLRRHGLTRATWCVLLALHVEGLTRPSEIAEFIGIDRTAISRALRQMEAAGWIARSGGTTDRRTTRVEITPEGAALCERAAPVAEENARHFLSKLPEEGARALQELMARLREGEEHNLPRF